jgi:hypothetical protein
LLLALGACPFKEAVTSSRFCSRPKKNLQLVKLGFETSSDAPLGSVSCRGKKVTLAVDRIYYRFHEAGGVSSS